MSSVVRWCCTAALFPWFALAAPQISLPVAAASPQSTVPLPVSFVSSGSSISAVQFDVQYDSSQMSLAAVPGDAARNANKNLYVVDIAAGRERFLIVGLNQTPLSDGVLVNLFAIFKPNVPPGSYTVSFSAVSASDQSGSAVTMGSANSTLSLQNGSSPAPLAPDGILNAATLQPGPIAPGEIITLLGSGIGAPAASNCPCSIWSNSITPGTADDPDSKPVEVGLKFRSDVAGSVTGVRFYKGSANTGTHVGHLWSSDGTLLASVTFTGETSSGWQQASFANPVQIQANTTYIVSYYAPAGRYASDTGYFHSGVDAGPLHALADGVNGANGVYAYGQNVFPSLGFNASNYWVDPVFSPAPDAGSTSVFINGVPALTLYSAPDQINASLPYGFSGNVSVQVQLQGQPVAQAQMASNPAAPGIFTMSSTGVGQGAILNQDYSVNSPSNPATPGSIVQIYGTGGGSLDPTTGLLSLPVSVTIGGSIASVTYAGPAPGLVSGVIQINCQLPQDVPAGPAVPISVQIGPAASPAGVTLAIQVTPAFR